MFVLQEPTIRDILVTYYSETPMGSMSFLIEIIEGIVQAPLRYSEVVILGKGYTTQFPIIGQYVIFPVFFITFIFLAKIFLHYYGSKKNELENLNTSKYNEIFKLFSYMIILLSLSFVFSLIHTLYVTGSTNTLINTFLPFLKGFDWSRLLSFTRTVIYICFALALCIWFKMLHNNKVKIIVYVIALIQLGLVFFGPLQYNYTAYNINHKNMVKVDGNLTYNEFYAEGFFDSIKTDLQYQGEGVAALGYHPAVLMYNGFSCLDGYNSFMPLSYHQAFREIIAPQLERNPGNAIYYDTSGRRAYIFNDDIHWQPTRIKVNGTIDLFINTEAFRNLGGVYILSRAEISNANELELTFVRKYNDESSIYEIFVYEAIGQ